MATVKKPTKAQRRAAHQAKRDAIRAALPADSERRRDALRRGDHADGKVRWT